MRFINESVFFDSIKSIGIERTADERSLRYVDDTAVLGFDFTNLTAPDISASPFETAGEGDRSVEYFMVSTLFRLVEDLDLFPLYLYAADNEWADEDLDRLLSGKHITLGEAAILKNVMEQGHGMDVAHVKRDEIKEAVRLITPQITTFSTQCCATDERGRFLTAFSHDEEVSFNTKDPEIYNRAKKFLTELKNLPFEIVRVEDFF